MQYTSAKLQFARHLRRESTDAERLLWFHLRDRRLGVKFRRQQPVGPFVVDFLSVEAMLIVELDGSQHDDAIDAGRTRFLERRGYRMLRFWNHDALVRTESVLEVILASVALTPTPLPEGEGLEHNPKLR
ncbi:DUF559 domain-containing protein [Luteimonas fraxinea]|uniref:DUF559 domain-containing protein n=1 Tax=Luteimonas fraxinea TaxID=2901869 RepID=A0ABS8UGN5_9GAMM|nr:DUF559 domain-containing protein [Luteimonas fraxinea]MCD9097660.1 DUF559 domain-containing protein [Luteimonas fraxinea]UHH08559.1 DUF559 domain-containing protein [Luteimonas fraxinea]